MDFQTNGNIPPQAYAPQPQAYAPQPQAYMPQPQAYMPQPQAYAPQPQAYAPQPQAYMPQPQAYMPQPQAYMPQPQAYAPQPQAYAPQPQAYMPQPQAYAPPGVYYAPPFAAGGRPQKNPRLRAASRALNRMCLLVLGQTAAAFFWQFLIGLALGFTAVGAQMLAGDDMTMSWITAALVPLSTALPFFLYMLIGGKDPVDYLKFQKVGLGWGLLCVIAGAGVCLLGNYPAFIIQDGLEGIGYSPLETSAAGGDTWASFALEFFSLAVLVPFMEEFVFRGVLLSSLRKYGIGFSIVASAIVFGLVHIQPESVVFATIAGLVMGFLYARTNNLWITIGIHGVNNGLAVLGSYSGLLFGNISGDTSLLATVCFMLAPIGLGLIALVLVVVFRHRLFPAPGDPGYEAPEQPVSGGEAALAVVRAPLFWAVAAIVVVYTLFFLFLA